MKGFTLVEVLAALFVFGLLAAGGAVVMGSTLNSQAAVRERVERLGQFQRLRASLKADLAQAAPRPTRDEAGRPAPPMLGRSGASQAPLLAFTRRGWDNPDAEARASLQYVEYALVEGRLERRSRAALDGAPLGEPQVLIEGVEGLELEYLFRGVWRRDWSGMPRAELPQAVRLTLSADGLGAVTQVFLAPGEVR